MPHSKDTSIATAAASAKADTFAASLIPVIKKLHDEGYSKPSELSRRLNEKGFRTRRGGLWQPQGIAALLLRQQKVRKQAEVLASVLRPAKQRHDDKSIVPAQINCSQER